MYEKGQQPTCQKMFGLHSKQFRASRRVPCGLGKLGIAKLCGYPRGWGRGDAAGVLFLARGFHVNKFEQVGVGGRVHVT